MNSLLFDIPKSHLEKLEKVQKNAARLVEKVNKSTSTTPILKELHWLPVEFRSQYKILLLVYKCLHGRGPAYLASMLEWYQPPRALRSAAEFRLSPRPFNKKYGERAFYVAGPRLWNELPLPIKKSPSVESFKKALKTYLFKLAYKNK